MKHVRCRTILCEVLEARQMLTTLNPSSDSFYRWTDPPRNASDEIRIEGTSSQLTRYHDRIDIQVATKALNAENIYTGWWAVFNLPEACNGGCAPQSLHDAATQGFIYYAGEIVVQPKGFEGFATFEASLERNQVCRDPRAAVCEPLVEEAWSDLAGADIGLLDPFKAAVHFVIRDHGRALSHPDLLHSQKSTFDGGCLVDEFDLLEEYLESHGLPLTPNQCGNVQFSVHDPIDVDFDEDGFVTGDDIDLLFAALGTTDEEYNLDHGNAGDVTPADLEVLLEEILLIERGDTNLDHRVDFADFLTLSNNFGSTDAGWSEGDFNGDRLVDFADFLLLSKHFGSDTQIVVAE